MGGRGKEGVGGESPDKSGRFVLWKGGRGVPICPLKGVKNDQSRSGRVGGGRYFNLSGETHGSVKDGRTAMLYFNENGRPPGGKDKAKRGNHRLYWAPVPLKKNNLPEEQPFGDPMGNKGD